jgi:hypothetical protein
LPNRNFQRIQYPPGIGIATIGGTGQGVSGGFIPPVPTIKTPASIPGTPQVGNPATAIDATWNNVVVSTTYQWKSAGVNGTGTGATTLTYTPVIGDLGNTLTITVIASNTGGSSAPSTSAASAAVIAASGSGGVLDFSQSADSALLAEIMA